MRDLRSTELHSMPLESLEHALGVTFRTPHLLKEALTHRSYRNEHAHWPHAHNERLEFLGDAVLELVVTEWLFAQYPASDEGELTAVRAALVNYQAMARLARALSIDTHLKMSRGEAKDVGRAREVILANAIEAVIGALYLDAGIEPVRALLTKHLLQYADEIMQSKSYKDPKSALQEWVQDRKRVTPTYRVLSEDGPAHQRTFTVGVYIGDELIAEGTGPAKQDAEVAAAKRALVSVGETPTA